jgi:methyl-accepting chemotaxis protein
MGIFSKLNLNNMNIGPRFIAIVLGGTAVTVIVALTAITQLANIGAEIKSIAEQDLPITSALTEITNVQLEQSTVLEQMLLAGGVAAQDEAKLRELEKTFDEESAEIMTRIHETEKLLADARDASTTEEQREEFQKLLHDLEGIDALHKTFETSAHELMGLLNDGWIAEAMGRIQGVIRETSEVATTIASAIEEQNAATEEISRNAQEAAAGTQQASDNMGKVNAGAVETSTAATQVLSASQELARNGDSLKGAIAGFLENLRAA